MTRKRLLTAWLIALIGLDLLLPSGDTAKRQYRKKRYLHLKQQISFLGQPHITQIKMDEIERHIQSLRVLYIELGALLDDSQND